MAAEAAIGSNAPINTGANDAQSPGVSAEDCQVNNAHVNDINDAHNASGNDTARGDAPAIAEHHDRSRSEKIKAKIAGQKGKIAEKAKKPAGGYDATPLPNLPSGYTVRFTFHSAANLPPSDLSSKSADPYINATLTADVPPRHKEDPAMVHRTRTIHRSTEPTWDEDWVVAGVPESGFRLQCRLYDEDPADHDDRLGNVIVVCSGLGSSWTDIEHRRFEIKKRMGSKRAYVIQAVVAVLHGTTPITPTLELSIRVLGRTDAPGGRLYTVGPTTWIRHFSPMIGRLTGTRVNRDETQDEGAVADHKQTKKYDFQANEIQLQGPVPAELYHRYVEFRPIIGRMFSSRGIRGRILNKALHKQHNRVYNFSRTTEYGIFEPCSEQAAIQFLKLAHFADGGRVFTYVITLDGMLRFTETGKEFGIDMLSKHTMHSDVATYIAYSGEFFIRRLTHARAVHSRREGSTVSAASPSSARPTLSEISSRSTTADAHPVQLDAYQLVIDNGSGTYRPDKSLLPLLKKLLEHNFPGLNVAVFHWEDAKLEEMKKAQLLRKKNEGNHIQMVLNHSVSSSSFSSSDESRLSSMGRESTDAADGTRNKSKKERALDLLENPSRVKELVGIGGQHHPQIAGEGPSAVK